MPYYAQLEGVIQTVDRIWMDPTNVNYLFFDFLSKNRDKSDTVDSATVHSLVTEVNNKLPKDAKLDPNEIDRDLVEGKKLSLNDLLEKLTRKTESHLKKYVKDLGVYQSNVILACVYKYFLEKADENREFFKQRTISVQITSDILTQSQKMSSLLLGINISMDQVRAYFSSLETGLEINDEILKSADPQHLYRIFVSRVQK